MPLQERVRIARKGSAPRCSSRCTPMRCAGRVAGGAWRHRLHRVGTRLRRGGRAGRRKRKQGGCARRAQAQEQAGEVNDILFDLTRRETRAYSNIFAKYLSERWKIAATLNKNPRRFAGFVVLKAPDVPSVLLELGYLSSAGTPPI